MEFEIRFFKNKSGSSPVEEFLFSLVKKNRVLFVKTKQGMEKLRNKAYHKEPLSKHVEKGLWEIRIKTRSDILRIFYTFEKGRMIILLHGFIKKRQETPVKELEIARKRLQEVKQRRR